MILSVPVGRPFGVHAFLAIKIYAAALIESSCADLQQPLK